LDHGHRPLDAWSGVPWRQSGRARALSHFGKPAARLSEKKPVMPEEKLTVSRVYSSSCEKI